MIPAKNGKNSICKLIEETIRLKYADIIRKKEQKNTVFPVRRKYNARVFSNYVEVVQLEVVKGDGQVALCAQESIIKIYYV